MASAGANLKIVPGKHANTHLLLQKDQGYFFLVEIIDKNVYEFTVCTYDNEDDQNRTEYVLHVNKRGLKDLLECIKVVLK
jgi:hypothetical protein